MRLYYKIKKALSGWNNYGKIIQKVSLYTKFHFLIQKQFSRDNRYIEKIYVNAESSIVVGSFKKGIQWGCPLLDANKHAYIYRWRGAEARFGYGTRRRRIYIFVSIQLHQWTVKNLKTAWESEAESLWIKKKICEQFL